MIDLARYPPRPCGDGSSCSRDGKRAMLEPELRERGFELSWGWVPVVVWHCTACPWKREVRFLEVVPCPE